MATTDDDVIDLDDPRWGGTAARPAPLPPPPPPIDAEPTDAHDMAVQAALYSRAVGCTRTREAVVCGEVIELSEQLPPDPAAARTWLQARRPGQWGERRQEQLHVVIDRLGDGRERIAIGYEQGGPLLDREVIEAEKISGPDE